VKLYASTLTFGNLAYVLRHHPQEEIYAALDEMETMIEVLPMDKQQLRKAIDHPSKDFEDMLQYQCAVAGGCECIVTRNKKDFKDFSALELFTADELADKI
jgi:predicted nucleic acid-binding protein